MTLKELMLGNIQSNQGTAVLQMGVQAAQKSGNKNEDIAFSDILDRRMSNTADRQYEVKKNSSKVSIGKKDTEPVYGTADNKQRYLAFREVKNSSISESTVRHETKLNGNQDNKLGEIDDDSDSIAQNEQSINQPDNMLHIFAQVMGLDISDLQKLLKEAGITSESFNNMQNISGNVSKLSQLLGLNNTQQNTLVKMLQLTAGTMESITAVNAEVAGQGMLSTDSKYAGNAIGTSGTGQAQSSSAMQETQTLASDLELLSANLNLKIKMKLNEFDSRLKADQSAVEAELKQLMQPLLQKAGVKIQEPVEVNADDTAGQNITALDAKAETAAAEDDSTGKEAGSKSEKEAAIPHLVSILNETQPQAAFAVIQPDKVNGADVMEVTTAKMPVEVKEIISQVIENAKVNLTPDKSEMVMDLKPDSLGKISLKVVTENGIVMAKFIAENQQVRQVLEANMQLLKDSLEKQGMSVQGFSVSVRQDSNQSAESWTQPEKTRNRSIAGTEYRTAGIEGSLADILEAAGRSNQYQWSNSTINLSA